MKVVIIATEASSDYLGYNLIKSLRKKKKKLIYMVLVDL
jgi:lipid A disaccharide synthetase